MNIESYKKDLDALISSGDQLHNTMQFECQPEEFQRLAKETVGAKATEFIEGLPAFREEYQTWYSEAKLLIRQLLPDRLSDFVRHYERPNSRKEVTYENYTIEDYLQDLTVKRFDRTIVVGPYAAVPRFRQQLSIVRSIRRRFESSLFDIRRLAQAELFDSELDAAMELAKNKFNRASGVVAGVVLERHLKEVCANHKVSLRKKAPQISNLNDALKKATVLDTPQWRSIQYLGDIRNLCAHDKQSEPTAEQVGDLLTGVARVTKTLF